MRADAVGGSPRGPGRKDVLVPYRLRCEHRPDPLGIDEPEPLLSWALSVEGSNVRAKRQTAYQILVARTPEALGAPAAEKVWDSGPVVSAETVGIPYRGPPLGSGRSYHWCVRAWDENGVPGPYGPPASWSMGLLEDGDWQAVWIGLGREPGGALQAPQGEERDPVLRGLSPAPYLRRSFHIDGEVVRATVYATAKGVYELRLNGSRVGAQELAPGWTDYRSRIHYQTFDVTDAVTGGENALGAILGDGWYAGYVGMDPKRSGAHYGRAPRLLTQLVVELADGRRHVIPSGTNWKSAVGPILYSDLLAGEAYDARRALPGWDRPGFDDSSWRAVTAEPRETALLEAQPDGGVRVMAEVPAQAIHRVADGVHVFDLGQNMVGRVRLRVRGPAGTKVTLRHAEALNEDGGIYTANLRSARQTDSFILAGEGEEIFEPHFTFHGFRYVEVTGYPGRPAPEAVTGRVLYSDTPASGQFECSNELVNRLQSNIVWGQRGNFLSVPTDCPQRDERLGWTGDAQVFARTACFNTDVAAFFVKWLRDLCDAQNADGAFPDIAPLLDFTAADMSEGAPAWGDAGVIVPWTVYAGYADQRVLERNYPAMSRWMDYLSRNNPEHLRENALGNNYGDWLSPGTETPKEVLATAYWAYDADLMSRIAGVLGREGDAIHYARLFDGIRKAFNDAYVGSDGRIHGDTQTCYVLALHMNLLASDQRPRAAGHLVRLIEENGGHLSTGFAGVSYLCPVLTDAGYPEVAYRLLLNESYPSWGYTIGMGATTVWERWDGWTQQAGFQSPNMNSFNHYSLGSVGEWLYRYVAGLDLDTSYPGYGRVLIKPYPGGGLTYARAEYDSVRGAIRSAWSVEGEKFRLDVSIPPNTSARLSLPAHSHTAVAEGGVPAGFAEGVTPAGLEHGRAAFELASGQYGFVVEGSPMGSGDDRTTSRRPGN